jgi:hypothetical protein
MYLDLAKASLSQNVFALGLLKFLLFSAEL